MSISRTRSRSPDAEGRLTGVGAGGQLDGRGRRGRRIVSGTMAVWLVAAAQAAQASASRQVLPLRSRVRASRTGPAQPR
ncbi:hypothetical protein WKI71_45640 [Streptomyces sp. MS1.AVA.1]|uniref:Uncharacterized protein n=1 Tax=Streptomyces machairae TaxID=3134109 RepID=A0ABU8UVW9_9ACTN